jgi:hypothetical protein
LDLLLEISDYVGDLFKLLGVLVGDVDFKFLFECHEKLDDIERICSKIVDKGGIGLDILLAQAKLEGNNFADLTIDRFGRHSRHPFSGNFHLYDFAALVKSAMDADAVRKLGLLALRADGEVHVVELDVLRPP